jgi:ADP-ribose pyrophosphatase YjhB (NUDIX family)
MNFCGNCGKPVHLGTPDGDHRERYICENCNTVHYQNPRVIVGCLPVWEGKVLLCKRANDPRSGFWTLPAGFLEIGETAEEGALRETREESHAEVGIEHLFALYSVPQIGQVYLFFLSMLRNLQFGPSAESSAVNLFSEEEIPWDDLAFPSVRFTLEHYFESRKENRAGVYTGAYLLPYNKM